MTYRVVQWATGHVGMHALRSIILHPDLELAGLWVHGADKVGRDAGELCGLDPTGVIATDDADALLALHPDCVSYMATGDLRPQEAVDDMCRILESGANLVGTSVVPLVYPPAAPRPWVDQIEAACKAGNTSCFVSGIDPGFANDLLPIVLSGFCQRIDRIRMMEVLNYATYDQAEVLFDTMGFGKPLDHIPLLLAPGSLTFAWGGIVQCVADALGVELDRIEEWHERRPAEAPFTISTGTVEAGTTAALRFEVRGLVGGEPRIVIEHVTRLHDDLAPDWPQPTGHGGYRVVVEGSPNYTLDLQMLGEDGDHNTAGVLGTAMRVLNAIPAVCAAAPGMLSVLDLPVIPGRGLSGAGGR
ncbi:MAG: diacylglycerol kinase [Actinobacteria bacterium]|nr:diacylglycerol kinase [Actinomycetota bacterium]